MSAVDRSGFDPDPAWLQEIDASLCVSSQFVVGGNTGDRVISRQDGGEPALQSGVAAALWGRLARSGFTFIARYEAGAGISIHPREDEDPTAAAAAAAVLGDLAGGERLSLERLSEAIERVAGAREHRCALAIERAGRLVQKPDAPVPSEYDFFLRAARAARGAIAQGSPERGAIPVFNPVIWIVENERELPDWFLGTGERLRTAVVPWPELDERGRMAAWLAPAFDGYDSLEQGEVETLVQRFASHSQGMTLTDMQSVMQLAKDRHMGLREIEDAVRGYRIGVLDNPWRQSSLREKVRDELAALERPPDERPPGSITRRVIGQDAAVGRSLDILARSVTSLTAAHRATHAIGPRGVLFFAGPTGVGKTELAKALTELVFGDSSAYTRFDMSEFAEASSAARLIGAPPGYIGFDAGGELTNAVRERPFSLILFDEIEKANQLIFDKFLQILEDGRLTDGRGGTTVFTEAILVFTSNLGITSVGADGSRVTEVEPGLDRGEAEQRVLKAIRGFFRPELVNRLGGNIIVFDYVTEEFADRILQRLLDNVATRVEREYEAKLTIAPAAREAIAEFALADLSNGGRGIGSAVEEALVNPLARQLVFAPPQAGGEVRVEGLSRDGRSFELECG